MPEENAGASRLVFFGSGPFGLPTLSALAGAGHEILAVVSQPDKPAGRGGKTRPTPISEYAHEQGWSVLTPDSPNTDAFRDELAALRPDLAVVVAYGHLIKKPVLAAPRHGFVNLHASLLPAYRGAAPVPWAILSGETVSGCSVFALDEKFDTGAVIGTASLPIEDDDTSGTYLEKLAPFGAQLMVRSVAEICAGRAVPEAQDDAKSSRAPKFAKADGLIDWTADFAVIERKIRAFQPWPLAYAFFETAKGPVRITVHKAARADIAKRGLPGAVLAADGDNGLVVMAGDAPVRLAMVRPDGKRAMADTDFLRGTKVKVSI
jgi:methionyl-tRNA formyltransferase